MKIEPYIIVVGMDFSELADVALLKAFESTLTRMDAEVHVVSVIQASNSVSKSPAVTQATNNETSELSAPAERLRAHVQAHFEAFDKAHAGSTPSGSLKVVSHVRVDSPPRGIVQLASDLDADLIVIGTHGRRGLERLLLGSVAEKTVRYAPCPVLVVPPKAEDNELKIEPPCPHCVRARIASSGRELWCEQHRERHGRRHTYHQLDRSAVTRISP